MRLGLYVLGIALCFMLGVACDASAQVASVVGKRLANGDALLLAGIEEPTPEGFSQVTQVCFRLQGGAQLGCVPRASFVAVGNASFQAEGELHDIASTLPADAQNVNLVAFLRVPLAEGTVLARTVDEDGDESEREEVIVFAAIPPPDESPKAPVLILLEELQGALDRAREQLAASE